MARNKTGRVSQAFWWIIFTNNIERKLELSKSGIFKNKYCNHKYSLKCTFCGIFSDSMLCSILQYRLLIQSCFSTLPKQTYLSFQVTALGLNYWFIRQLKNGGFGEIPIHSFRYFLYNTLPKKIKKKTKISQIELYLLVHTVVIYNKWNQWERVI